MNEILWNDRFNIGVEVVDKAHRRLFSIIDKLFTLNEDASKQQHACREGIKYFKSYTLKHFAEEEAYMQSIGYSGYTMHKSLHDNLRDNTLPALERELEEQNYSIESVQHFLGFCVGWLNGHILVEDRAITGKIPNKWIHQASEDETESLAKAIIQTLQQLYHAKAELVSKHYGGEDFTSGSALCYRLSYLTQNGKKLQVFFLYEEQFVLRMLSELLGKQIHRIDKTVVHAIKAISQKFMECIRSHFELSEEYQLQKDDILTFEQLVRTFDKGYPPYSLLFNMEKKGYFVFCVR
ncbi:MAG: hemerythrin family protein [Acetatifactor sp.]|nr:hemerythrin family protein [Acetatifactor sp.]